jgi:hypothetical protein
MQSSLTQLQATTVTQGNTIAAQGTSLSQQQSMAIQLSSQIASQTTLLSSQATLISSLTAELSSVKAQQQFITTNFTQQLSTKVDTRSLGVIDPQVTTVVNAMATASAGSNNLAGMLAAKIGSSPTCQCVDPQYLTALSATVQATTTAVNKTLSCHGTGLVFQQSTDQCAYARPTPTCPATIAGLTPRASITSCTGSAAVGPYLAGTTCVVACNAGYIAASTTYVCNSTSTWQLTGTALTCTGASRHRFRFRFRLRLFVCFRTR